MVASDDEAAIHYHLEQQHKIVESAQEGKQVDNAEMYWIGGIILFIILIVFLFTHEKK